MSLPYEWRPDGTRFKWDGPEVGDLMPFEHAVYRVIAVRDRRTEPGHADDERPIRVVLRPVEVSEADPARARDRDLHLGAGASYVSWQVYPDEHYPICAACHEPLPCREQMAERVAEASAKRFDRYTTAGVCPDCQEPVSQRQKSLTWEDNVVVPGGPPVTFHMRNKCRYSASVYEKRWVAADPERRKALLTCPGHVTNHGDGTYECTQMVECPGPTAAHPSYTVCADPWHMPRTFGCTPPPNAKRIGGDLT